MTVAKYNPQLIFETLGITIHCSGKWATRDERKLSLNQIESIRGLMYGVRTKKKTMNGAKIAMARTRSDQPTSSAPRMFRIDTSKMIALATWEQEEGNETAFYQSQNFVHFQRNFLPPSKVLLDVGNVAQEEHGIDGHIEDVDNQDVVAEHPRS